MNNAVMTAIFEGSKFISTRPSQPQTLTTQSVISIAPFRTNEYKLYFPYSYVKTHSVVMRNENFSYNSQKSDINYGVVVGWLANACFIYAVKGVLNVTRNNSHARAHYRVNVIFISR